MKRLLYFVLLLFLLKCAVSCKKQTFITDQNAALTITADTLRFDTVFTSIGSVTQYFTIINSNSQKLQLSSIKLMGGNSSVYKINVDGNAAAEISNVEMNAGDSIYVFVSVTIDPSLADLPFIVQDSIQVNYNGNQKYIQLEAYGQNAHFLRNHYIDTDTTWNNVLPYVIFGGIQVAQNSTLTIEKGCRIYLHADAPFIVDGTLIVNGTAANPVSFQGNRLDNVYRDLPSSWPGIYFRQSSINNAIQYGIIKNAYQGVIAVGPATNALPKLQLRECIIDNIYDAGILALGSDIDAVNCLISNCGSNIVINAGGAYRFTYCTMVSYDNNYISHKKPVLTLGDTDEAGSSYALNALFRNCIVWAGGNNVENEVHADRKGNAAFNVHFDHVLYKAKNISPDIHLMNSIANQDPSFDSINADRRYFDFHIGKNPSPAAGAGTPVLISHDLDGKARTGDPDLGCYTKH
ncbi:hypothetical protein [Agriterribacter sp.]|uniref:hypothetical protein n=1 Tax=Agriterribacter sp. TaxID=2821509 RepID=UPI002C72F3C1|nr:hypothetical protein [Agriterribacter sp.]HRO46882.1 hypothetical protein [Agriterribacter sp.]HRQ18219.1 hypothetical protein [Agriterribacter sp.]